MTPADYLNAIRDLQDSGELAPVLRESLEQSTTLLRDEYLPLYAAVATIAVSVELVLVGVLLWWAWRSDRLTEKWRRRLLAALPVAVLFGGVRLMLSPSVVGVVWLACVAAAWWLVFTRVRTVDGKETAA